MALISGTLLAVLLRCMSPQVAVEVEPNVAQLLRLTRSDPQIVPPIARSGRATDASLQGHGR